MSELAYKAAFIALFCALTVIRTTFWVTTGHLASRFRTNSDGLALLVSRAVLGVVLATLFILHLWAPGLAHWAVLALPAWLRTAGIAGGLLALLLLLWTHQALGANFSTTVDLRPNPRLVESGPYRWMRHPMYTAYAMFFVCAFLVSQNWAIGLSGLGVIVPLMTVRLVREERVLQAQFGSAYAEYARRTARFLPLGSAWRAAFRRTARRLPPSQQRQRD